VLLLALLVGVSHVAISGSSVGAAVMTALAVVLIACPCAMGLAVPAAVLAACSRSAALGIILRGGDVIERMAQIQTALFDKTGTITIGQPQVERFETYHEFSEADVIQAAATLEEPSAHPLARSIVQHAAGQGLLPELCRDFQSVPGRGISGVLSDGRRVVCGNVLFLQERGCAVADTVAPDSSSTAILVAIDGRLAGRYLLQDQVRFGAGRMVAGLAAQAIDIQIISGDQQATVERIAVEIGIVTARGGMTPDQKLDHIQALQKQGRSVLMAGDGVNDAPALAAATVSCSLTGASDIAMENADIIIVGDDLTRITDAHRLCRATMAIIKQNLAWAFLYNLVGIPLAASGHLTPLYAAGAMTASSLLVSLNSLRLMRFKHHG
jgi:Cu2+-exporting ATPase